MEASDILTGSEIKLISLDATTARVGGYLIRYSTAADPDLSGEYFTKDTDFGIESGHRLPLYYNHGTNTTIKGRRMGAGTVTFDDVGAWFEAEIALADDYAEKVLALVMQGKAGYSSGAVAHLVTREKTGGAMWIKSWVPGEASITPTPCEPRNAVAALKADTDEPGATDPNAGTVAALKALRFDLETAGALRALRLSL